MVRIGALTTRAVVPLVASLGGLLDSKAMRAVLFDFGGTLDCPRHWLDRFLTHYQAAGLKLGRTELAPAFEAATHTAYGATASLLNYNLRQLIPYLVGLQLTFLGAEEKTKRPDLSKALRSPSAIDRVQRWISEGFIGETEAGLARSRQVVAPMAENLSIGVVSNFYGNLKWVLADAGFDGMISAIADSGRLGIYKPEAGIFEAALAMIGVRAAEAMMVGDSLEKDCAPARRLGMRTVWLRHREARAPGDLAGVADFTITALAELKELL